MPDFLFEEFLMPSWLTRFQLLRSILQTASGGRPCLPRRAGPRFRPRLERLEEREVLTVLTVTTLLDNINGSLRAEVFLAQDGDTVQFANGLSGKITLSTGE